MSTARKSPAKAPRKAAAASATIWTLKVKLVFGIYTKGPWEATLEMDSNTTLEELHWAIQDAAGFENDHPYAFYVARTWRGRSTRSALYSDQEDDNPLDTALAELFPLPTDRRLFYWFDFGDDWRFCITRTRPAPQVPVRGQKYPRLIATEGETPVQYPSMEERDGDEWYPYAVR